jgi:hypothetical protein
MILGILATLATLFILAVVRLFLSRWVERSFQEVLLLLRQDDPEILGELFNTAMERHLSDCLSQKQFRKEQLKRIRVAHEHIDRRTHNVVVWQEWGDTELRKSRLMGNEEARLLADALVVACAEFRMGTAAVQMQLRIWFFKMMLLPGARVPRITRLRRIDDFDLLESYEKIKRAALELAKACGGDYYERLCQAL